MTRFLRKNRSDFDRSSISTKVNVVLRLILIAMILILVRVWHLSVIDHDAKYEESEKPKVKAIIEPAIRGSIRDRFNVPLATHEISYQATILYSQLKDIPSFVYESDDSGKKIKRFKRREYVKDLSALLGKELALNSERIEDLIHAKASYYSQLPFVIKDDLTEQEYYRLKMLEKNWPGLYVRFVPRRYYPLGRLASHIVGYMGAIDKVEYEKILHEMKSLEQFIWATENGQIAEDIFGISDCESAKERLRGLQAKAYTQHDYIGKTGIEFICENILRGSYGKRYFTTDSRGNFLSELSGSTSAQSGQRILLTLSSELQEYAEQLLAQNETVRIPRKTSIIGKKKTVFADKEPWIKGGAIVVMDPSTGEILTLASYPRFDPNDFVLSHNIDEQKIKKACINHWFENGSYLADIWNGRQPLSRERYDLGHGGFFDEVHWMDWKEYLKAILPVNSDPLKAALNIISIRDAIEVQNSAHEMLKHCPGCDLYAIFNALYTGEKHEAYPTPCKDSCVGERISGLLSLKKKVDPYVSQLSKNWDKVLIVDLCRLAVDSSRFSQELSRYVGNTSLEDYHKLMGSFVVWRSYARDKAKEIFHKSAFQPWREQEGAEFIKAKRKEEKERKTYPKPYIDYLDEEENIQFEAFWDRFGFYSLYALILGRSAIDAFSSDIQEVLDPYWEEFLVEQNKLLNEVTLREKEQFFMLSRAIQKMPCSIAIEYLKSIRPYEELNRPLLGKYKMCQKKRGYEKYLATAFYPVNGYGYGRSYAYRQSSIQGSLFKLVTAYEALIQRFQKMGKRVFSKTDLNPLIITDKVFYQGENCYVGYTEDGKPIPQIYKGGRIPRSLAHQNNGRVDLVKAFEMSSNPYFALLAGEYLDHPEDLSEAAEKFGYGQKTGIDLPGEIKGNVPHDLDSNRTGLYAMAIGQHSLVVTPLQTAVMLSAIANGGKILKPKLIKLTAEIKPDKNDKKSHAFHTISGAIREIPTEVRHEIFMPEVIRQILLEGLSVTVKRTYQESFNSLTRLYKEQPEAIATFAELKDQILGKTSTSESVENMDLDLLEGTNIYTHVWFGGIAIEKRYSDRDKAYLLLKDEYGQVELVVVVYLRYGGYGKEAAPLTAQIVKKWREIKTRSSSEDY